MVDVAPAGGPVATGEDTVEVSGHYCDSEGWGDQSFGSSHVEGLTVGSEDDSGQVGVTGDPSDLVGGEEGPMFGFCESWFVFEEGFGGDMDDEAGSVSVRFDHFEEEVGPSGGNIAGVTREGGTGFESGGELFAGFDVHPSVDPHHPLFPSQIQGSHLPNQVALFGQFVPGYLIEPVVELLAKFSDRWSVHGQFDQSSLRGCKGLRSDCLGFGENIDLCPGDCSPVVGHRGQWHFCQGVGSTDQTLRLTGVK